MYLGRIVEQGDAKRVFARPKHPYTTALLESVLTPDPSLGVPDTHLGTAYPNPLEMPEGCTFHPRCARVLPRCRREAPFPVADPDGRRVECHLFADAGAAET